MTLRSERANNLTESFGLHADRWRRISWQSLKRPVRIALWLLLVSWGLFGLTGMPDTATAQNPAGEGKLALIKLDSAIDPVSERYLVRELDKAQEDVYSLAVILLDTPGGLLDSTRVMVNAVLTSRIPTAVYVSPSGSHAASAGTFIAAAANILAMAPVTEIGAASVVGSQGEDLDETLQAKANEDAAALLRGIANQRDRNVEALEATIFDARAYSAEEAVELGIADLLAKDLDELLLWAEGKTVETAAGSVTISGILNSDVEERSYSVWDRFLSLIANPNLAFIFISLGTLALIVELWTFGTFIPGTIGIVLLVLGFAGLGQLPFQWAGLALIVLAFALIAAEIFVSPGLGFFGVAGAIALILGGLFLFPFPSGDAPDLQETVTVSRWLLAAVGAIVLGFVIWLIWELRKVSKNESYIPIGSSDLLRGQTASVTKMLNPEGEIYIAGEHWTARTQDQTPVEIGDSVRIVDIDGVTLIVKSDGDDEASRTE